MSKLTPMQVKIGLDLTLYGPSTSAQIAERTGLTVKQVSNSASFARGHGVFNDGSVEYVWPGPGHYGCMHRPDGEGKKIKGHCPDRYPDGYEEFAAAINAEVSETQAEEEEGLCP
jgi:hypothetical protein